MAVAPKLKKTVLSGSILHSLFGSAAYSKHIDGYFKPAESNHEFLVIVQRILSEQISQNHPAYDDTYFTPSTVMGGPSIYHSGRLKKSCCSTLKVDSVFNKRIPITLRSPPETRVS